MTRRHAILFALAVGLSTEIHAAATVVTPIEPLCRDYREFTERRPMVDRQQVALLPKFQTLEEVCLTEGKAPVLFQICVHASFEDVQGSCCAGPWDCMKSSQASCESMEGL